MGLRSSLAPHAAAMREAQPEQGRVAARRAWQDQGIALIRLEWVRGQDRELLIALTETVHGRRPAGSG